MADTFRSVRRHNSRTDSERAGDRQALHHEPCRPNRNTACAHRRRPHDRSRIPGTGTQATVI